MKKLFLSLFIVLMAFGMSVEDAEARRLGGGRSSGIQRSAPSAPSRQANNPASPQNPAAPAAGRNWTGPLAGLAAGLGLGYLFSSMGFGAGMSNILMMALLAFAAIALVRFFARKINPNKEAQTQFAGNAPKDRTEGNVYEGQFTKNVFSGASSNTSTASFNAAPDFDVEGFLRIAKLNFVRLQAANDEKNLTDIREFVSPEMYAEIKLQMDERGDALQQTEVVTLTAELIEQVAENNSYIASVLFSGTMREESTNAEPFKEIWHLTKPINGASGWKISGIQQA